MGGGCTRRGLQGGRVEVPTSRSHPPVLVSLFKGFAGAEPGTTTHPSPLVPRCPRSPPACPQRVPRARHSFSLFLSLSLSSALLTREEETVLRGSHSARRALRTVTRARWRPRVRAYARGRVAAGARHEALEKRRCPRMYFLIIDFNDEGSRCQRHLGCWAE